MKLQDSITGETVNVAVSEGPNGIEITPEGTATFDSDQGSPIFIESYDGKLRIHVWSDINSEDPTHTIELDGALTKNRHP